MTDIYSALLAFAVGALACSALFLIASRWRRVPLGLVTAMAWAALILDAASLVYHRFHDHAAGSLEHMPGVRFLAAHPAFTVVAVASATVLAISARRSKLLQRAA